MPVKRCMAEVDAREFAEWVAFDEIEGIGQMRLLIDHASAALQCILANINRDTKKRKQPFRIDEFRMFPGKPQKQTREEQYAVARTIAAAFPSAVFEEPTSGAH